MTRRARAEIASGFTVLLVDDNADYLQATRLLLEREGHNVLTATNGPALGAYQLLTSTNVAQSVATWTVLTSGNFNAGGNLSITAPVTADPQRFYLIKLP